MRYNPNDGTWPNMDRLNNQRIEKLEAALRAIEAHHVEQNRLKGRPEDRSTTLRIIRDALK